MERRVYVDVVGATSDYPQMVRLTPDSRQLRLKALVPPPKVKEVTGGYLDEHNPLREWLAANFIITHYEGDIISATELRAEFLIENPDTSLTAVKFKELMGYNGVNSKHTMRGNVFFGLKRRSDVIEHV